MACPVLAQCWLGPNQLQLSAESQRCAARAERKEQQSSSKGKSGRRHFAGGPLAHSEPTDPTLNLLRPDLRAYSKLIPNLFRTYPELTSNLLRAGSELTPSLLRNYPEAFPNLPRAHPEQNPIRLRAHADPTPNLFIYSDLIPKLLRTLRQTCANLIPTHSEPIPNPIRNSTPNLTLTNSEPIPSLLRADPEAWRSLCNLQPVVSASWHP